MCVKLTDTFRSLQETYVLWDVLFVDDGMGKENVTNEDTATIIYRDLERAIMRGGDMGMVCNIYFFHFLTCLLRSRARKTQECIWSLINSKKHSN